MTAAAHRCRCAENSISSVSFVDTLTFIAVSVHALFSSSRMCTLAKRLKDSRQICRARCSASISTTDSGFCITVVSSVEAGGGVAWMAAPAAPFSAAPPPFAAPRPSSPGLFNGATYGWLGKPVPP